MKGNAKVSQVQNLVVYLNTYGYITQLIARQVFGVERLASRINDLKNLGYEIRAEHCKDMADKRYTRYHLVK